MPFIKLSDIEEREMVKGFRARFIHTDQVTTAHWQIAAGSTLPDHSHPHEQVTIIINGRFEMTVDAETRTIEAGDVVVIPSGAKHRGRALTDCFILDVFSPVREDYR
ncbi:MAG: cupin domain-containing protein [Syntrophus sp. (in: bacteria)]|nr:cupin domain-containing protein [Syntrophus sp. (in: bacteria)]